MTAMRTGPRVWPRRRMVLFKARNVPRFSSGAAALRREKTLGRFRLWATPKITAGTNNSHTEGTNATKARAAA